MRHSDVAERARADAERQRAYEAEQAKQPSELQERVARDVEQLLGVEVDPLSVAEEGYKHPYYPCSVTVLGLTFHGHYLWGGRDWRYHRTSSAWTVTRKAPGRLFGSRTQTRNVWSLGDLDGWFS